MSLESNLQALTAAVVALTEAVKHAQGQALPVVPAPVAAPVAAPVPPVPVAQPVAPAVAATAPAMPAPPSFAAPAAPAAPAPGSNGAVPFADTLGMTKWVMEKYQALGPQRGAGIQGVLNSLGVGNINHVQPGQYAQLVAAIEEL